ncbi:MAG: hypothetical protein A4E48_00186 [Methanosaeta sp. PtaU1.Bin060]|nr:MAG: hypothetical protein A4E48_00186 [Methanosaeta sp. PtaU1.Bin060]
MIFGLDRVYVDLRSKSDWIYHPNLSADQLLVPPLEYITPLM